MNATIQNTDWFRAEPNKASRMLGRDWTKSLLAHAVLVALLVFSVQWKSKHDSASAVTVELFSPPTRIEMAAEAPVKPTPSTKVEVSPKPLPQEAKPDIALNKAEKAKLEKEKLDKEKLEKERLAADEKLKEQRLKEQKARDQALKDKVAADKLAAQQLEDKQREDKQREETLRKIMGAAPATGLTDKSANASAASNSAMMDAGYTGRLRSLIRGRTIFQAPDMMSGNPKAEFVLSLLPDCSVTGVKLKKSSGLKVWDDAAERALLSITNLPRPATGNCPATLEVAHQPKE